MEAVASWIFVTFQVSKQTQEIKSEVNGQLARSTDMTVIEERNCSLHIDSMHVSQGMKDSRLLGGSCCVMDVSRLRKFKNKLRR